VSGGQADVIYAPGEVWPLQASLSSVPVLQVGEDLLLSKTHLMIPVYSVGKHESSSVTELDFHTHQSLIPPLTLLIRKHATGNSRKRLAVHGPSMWKKLMWDGLCTYPTEQAIKAATANPNSNGCFSHNHELILSQTVSLLNPNMRSIPPDMHDTAVLLQKAHMSPSKIFDFLMRSCLEKGIDVMFNETDIRNKYASSSQHNILDCTNLVEHLKDRER
jgi:hypothetical protein